MKGGYDNESVAVSAMCLTFWLWVRATRELESASKTNVSIKTAKHLEITGSSTTLIPGRWAWLWSIGAGLAYTNMAAAWGGYVFVVNIIGVHAAVLLVPETLFVLLK